ncbi:MAG TPA: N-acetylglutaminylglutamine synthetase [Gammaproteobacteria bacterium]|nr:N-acetylglutaminylglutamine synthetase [Gammaproteobacteria bacterium]
MPRRHSEHRIQRTATPAFHPWRDQDGDLPRNVVVDCGWGRLIFAHTFTDNREIARTLCEERPGQRDIALYLRDPHVVLSLAPQELFLDPSHTYRLWLFNWRSVYHAPPSYRIRRLRTYEDAAAINRLYAQRHMVEVDPEFIWENRLSRTLTYFLAEDMQDGRVIGSVTGVDHVHAFDDPENGSSLWCLAVDGQAAHPGIGQMLVAQLADHYLARGRAFVDLSVLHDNTQAIALYEKLGFVRVPVFCVKHKNPINERLFMGPEPTAKLNPYSMIIINEARRRGIAVSVIDAEHNYFSLSFGGRTITCRESLSELTSAIAMSRCDNKLVTARLLEKAGLRVPRHRKAGSREDNLAFLRRHGSIVVKPARGEQGQGVSAGVSTEEELEAAIETAKRYGSEVMLEEFVQGEDLRVIVIGYRVVAAAVRRPPQVIGTGLHSIRELIDRQSRRRLAATGGESRIPLDEETVRSVRRAGYELDDILPEGELLRVRSAANLHTGGTIHDVTGELGKACRRAAEKAARVLQIPVVGLDFLVPAPDAKDYVIIEANERPGLANHEPQPTAERFVDLLFPQTAQGMS